MNAMNRGRILALDYGKKNVGIACSDELGVTVRPLPSISNHNFRSLVRRLLPLLGRYRIERIVVGMPLNMDGTAGDAVCEVEHFIERLRGEVNLPLESCDERLSTVEAMELWREMSPRRQRTYRTLDSLAAALILERFLRET